MKAPINLLVVAPPEETLTVRRGGDEATGAHQSRHQ
jgi:hypothetical protein